MIDNKTRIEDILKSIARIIEITDCSYEAFINSIEKQEMVSYHFIIIGEASSRITKDFKDKYPQIPWATIIAMRNIIVHEYMRTDYKIIWKTAKKDLLLLKQQLEII